MTSFFNEKVYKYCHPNILLAYPFLIMHPNTFAMKILSRMIEFWVKIT